MTQRSPGFRTLIARPNPHHIRRQGSRPEQIPELQGDRAQRGGHRDQGQRRGEGDVRRPRRIAPLGLCVLALALVGLAPSTAAAAVPSTSALSYGTNGNVNAIATLGDTIYLGGQFTQVGLATGGGAAFAAADGQADASIPAISGGDHTVDAVVPDGSGGWYIGGGFTHVGGLVRHNIAHVLANGSVDPAFNPNANDQVDALAASGSTLYVGGNSTARARSAAPTATTSRRSTQRPAKQRVGTRTPMMPSSRSRSTARPSTPAANSTARGRSAARSGSTSRRSTRRPATPRAGTRARATSSARSWSRARPSTRPAASTA